jgi:hypothetical protein
MSFKKLAPVLFAVVAAAGTAGAQSRVAAMRFKEMDRNGDGIVSAAEWRGSKRSFAVHDWNGDGRLAGDEVRVGATRPRADQDPLFDSADREYIFGDWTDRGFRALDHNRDGRITADEWHFDREGYRRADHNRDGIISRAEFLNEAAEDDDRDDQFSYLDDNGDGRIARAEWHAGAGRFNALDENRDGFLSRTEIVGNEPPPNLFASVDVNRDRAVSLDEWHWSRVSFNERDRNGDGRLTEEEFDGRVPAAKQSAAYRAGFERGSIEGRTAGRAERLNKRAWDLEGQRELEAADSGYRPDIGPKAEYQAAYREAFRRAYEEGWNQAK